MDVERLRAFERALTAMAEFKQVFGRSLDSAFIAELYAEKELDLKLCSGINTKGYDLHGPNGERYQIKFRNAQTRHVDCNNFDFDYLVLVNLDDKYQLIGMWRITSAQAQKVFTQRENYNKYQARQADIKAIAERVR
jgi:hypothetical protein